MRAPTPGGKGSSLGRIFGRRPRDEGAEALYQQIVQQGRDPRFYGDLGVPDTLDGRFEMLALHLFLVLHRLRRENDDASRSLTQSLTDSLVADMDGNLREMGAGDLGVGRRVRRMAEGFNGRVAAYDAGLSQGTVALREAIRRNVYGTVEPTPQQVAALAVYVEGCRQALEGIGIADLAHGIVRFAAVPMADSGAASRR